MEEIMFMITKQKMSVVVVFAIIMAMGVSLIAATDYSNGIHILNSGSIKINIDDELYVYDLVADEFVDTVEVKINGEGNASRLLEPHQGVVRMKGTTEFTEEDGFIGDICIDGYDLMDNVITLENTDEKVYRNKCISRTQYGTDRNIEIINYINDGSDLILEYDSKNNLYNTYLQYYLPTFNVRLSYDTDNTDKFLIQIEKYEYTPDNETTSQITYITNINDNREVLKMIIASDIFYNYDIISTVPMEIIEKYDLYDYWKETSIDFCKSELNYSKSYQNNISNDEYKYDYCGAKIEYLEEQIEALQSLEQNDLLVKVIENTEELDYKLGEINLNYGQNNYEDNMVVTVESILMENENAEIFYVDESDNIVKMEIE